MRDVYITAFSKSLENLRVEAVPDPIVTGGKAKIKMLAASVNPSDVKNIQGKARFFRAYLGRISLASWSMGQPIY